MSKGAVRRMKLSDGVLVLIITACTYLFSFAFEIGYYQAKKIPVEFINIDFTFMLKTGFVTCIAICVISFLINIFIKPSEDLKVSNNFKVFIIRYGLVILTIVLYFINLFLDDNLNNIIPFLLILCIFIREEFGFIEKTGSKIWYKRRYRLSMNLSKIDTTVMIVDKFNLRAVYVYISWFLALLFLLYNIGGFSGHISKETLVCNKDMNVVNVSGEAVLVTRNYKEFMFIDKTKCEFSIPPIKK